MTGNERRSAPLPRLRDVPLVGRALTLHRGDAVVRIVCAVVMVVSLFLPWHVVHQTTAMDLSGFFCAMTPDCHPGPPEPVHDTGVTRTCTGLTHSGGAILGFALALGVLSAVPLVRRRLFVSVACTVVSGLLAVLLAAQATMDMTHLFDRVEVLIGQRVFETAAVVCALSSLVGVVTQPFAYRWSRRVALDRASARPT